MTLGFKCNQCDIYFSNLANLKNHFKRTENHKMYFVKKECFDIENDCKVKFFNSRAELNQHLVNAHQRNSKFSNTFTKNQDRPDSYKGSCARGVA